MYVRELNATLSDTKLSHQELNEKQVYMLVFIVSYKVCIVTIITSDLSGVFILININL